MDGRTMNTPELNSGMKEKDPRATGISRRRCLGAASAAITGFSLVPRYVLGGAKFVAPSETINIAIVGCGGQGQTNVRTLFNHEDAQIIAVADPVEEQNL